MTKAHESIYCIQCLCVKPKAEAELVFRTGFYKVTMPLGRCVACASTEQPAAALFLRMPAAERGSCSVQPA